VPFYRVVSGILLLLIMGSGVSEATLKINGRAVPGITTKLVPGFAYMPALELAEAMGAKYILDRDALLAAFDVGGRLVQVRIVNHPEDSSPTEDGININNAQIIQSPGVFSDGYLFVPIKSVVQAFNGSFTYQESDDQFLVVLPRARIENHQVFQDPQNDRIVIHLSQIVPHEVFFNSAVDTITIRFQRTDLSKAQSFKGRGFSRANLIPGTGFTELQVQIEPSYTHRIFELPRKTGTSFIMDILPASTEQLESDVEAQRIVIDPGHGGEEVGELFLEFGWERDLVLDFSHLLAETLSKLGFAVELTRTSDRNPEIATRSGQGFGANLFVSIHAGDHPRGQYSIFYLEEAEGIEGLDYAVRENAGQDVSETATNELRRKVLLNVIPNLDMGRRFAFALNDIMFQKSGYVSNTPRAAPLTVLAGAGGRGLLLEFGPQDLTSTSLVDALASALGALATGGF